MNKETINWDELFDYDFKYFEADKYIKLFPELERLKGLKQGKLHYLDAWSHTVEALKKFDFIRRNIDGILPNTFHHFRKFFRNFHQRIILKLGILLHDIGKPFVAEISEEGYPVFPEHAKYGRELLKKYDEFIPKEHMKKWKEVKYLVGFHLYFLNLYNKYKESGQKDFERPLRFERSFVYKLIIVSMADLLATVEKDKIFDFGKFVEYQIKNWYEKDVTTFTFSTILKDVFKNIRKELK